MVTVSLFGCETAPPAISAAVRADDGVLTVLLPMCPEWRVKRAAVAPMSESSFAPAAWTGEGFLGSDQAVVTLDEAEWKRASGNYDGLTGLDVSVEVSGYEFGFEAQVSDSSAISNLPPGVFLSGPSTRVTEAQFAQAADELFDCDGTSPQPTTG
jgi:hypothetical protein